MKLRLAEPDDVAAIVDIYNHEVVHGTGTFDTEVVTVAARAQWLTNHDPARHPVVVAVQPFAPRASTQARTVGDGPGGWCLTATEPDRRGAPPARPETDQVLFDTWSVENAAGGDASRGLATRQALDTSHLDDALPDERVMGWASLSAWSERCAYARAAEVSVYVHADCRRRGVGRALLAELIRRAQGSGLGVLLARICSEGAASLALHSSLGFAPIGTMRRVGEKFGRVLDIELMDLHLNDVRAADTGRDA